MDKGTTFTTSVDGTTYNYITNEEISTSVDGVFKFSNVSVYEGTATQFRYTVDEQDLAKIYYTGACDTSTLKVKVQTSLQDATSTTFTQVTGLTKLSDESLIYFLNETETGKFQVTFGDGVLGRKLQQGNIVILDYIVSNKSLSNGAKTFTLQVLLVVFQIFKLLQKVYRKVVVKLETKESIRYNARYNIQRKIEQLQLLTMKEKYYQFIPNAQSVSGLGGEDDETCLWSC